MLMSGLLHAVLVGVAAAEAGNMRSKQHQAAEKVASDATSTGALAAELLVGIVRGDPSAAREAARLVQPVLKDAPALASAPLLFDQVEMQVASPSEATFISVAPIATGIGFAFVWGVMAGSFAYYYKFMGGKEKVMEFVGDEEMSEAAEPLVDRKTWSFRLFSCFDAPKFLLFSCLCGAVRWSDTIDMVGILEFTKAASIIICLSLVSSFLSGLGSFLSLLVSLGVIGFYTRKRQQLRELFGMQHGDTATILEDFATYCLCGICAVTQEGRQVEHAAKMGKLPQAPEQSIL